VSDHVHASQCRVASREFFRRSCIRLWSREDHRKIVRVDSVPSQQRQHSCHGQFLAFGTSSIAQFVRVLNNSPNGHLDFQSREIIRCVPHRPSCLRRLCSACVARGNRQVRHTAEAGHSPTRSTRTASPNACPRCLHVMAIFCNAVKIKCKVTDPKGLWDLKPHSTYRAAALSASVISELSQPRLYIVEIYYVDMGRGRKHLLHSCSDSFCPWVPRSHRSSTYLFSVLCFRTTTLEGKKGM
jgi:hypothetical protein